MTYLYDLFTWTKLNQYTFQCRSARFLEVSLGVGCGEPSPTAWPVARISVLKSRFAELVIEIYANGVTLPDVTNRILAHIFNANALKGLYNINALALFATSLSNGNASIRAQFGFPS